MLSNKILHHLKGLIFPRTLSGRRGGDFFSWGGGSPGPWHITWRVKKNELYLHFHVQAETCMDRFLASATFRQWAKGEYDITSFFSSHWRMPVDLIYCLLFPEDSFIDLVIKQQMQSEATSGHRHGDLMRGLWFPMSQPSCFPPSVFHVFPET